MIHDLHGSVTREIRSIKDVAGNVLRYAITVRDYGYTTASLVDELEHIFVQATGSQSAAPAGASHQGAMWGMTEYRTFEIDGPDNEGLRYRQMPGAALNPIYYGV